MADHKRKLSVNAIQDSDSSDDEFADMQCYKEEDEPLPNAPAFDNDFQSVQKRIQDLITGLQAAIPGELRQGHLFGHVAQSTQDLLQSLPSASRKYRINIVGKSGAGKSSLLNSLLGRPGLAKALSASKACTHVPASCEDSFPGQQQSMAVKIEFRTPKEIRELVDQLLQDYYSYTEEKPQSLLPEERLELSTACSTAFNAFRSLFREKREFSSESVGKEYLKLSYKKPRAVVVDQLVEMSLGLIAQAQQQQRRQQGTDFKGFDSQDPLQDFVKPYAFSSSRSTKSALWPVVKLIRLGLSGVPILKFVTLTDWPGWDDTNRLRAEASKDCLHNCDEMWFVSPADRIASDPVLLKRLGQYCHDIPCVVVCTHVEDKLDGGLAKTMEDEGEDIGDYDQLDSNFQDLKQKIQTKKAKLAKRERGKSGQVAVNGGKRLKMDPEKQTKWVHEVLQLNSTLRSDQESLDTVAEQRLDLLVSIRKRYIDHLLQKQVFDKLDDGHFRVFCVSNSHYSVHKTADFAKGQHLSVQATGVPDLRRHIFEEAAQRLLKDVKEFLNIRVAGLIDGAMSVTTGDCFNGRDEVLRIIEGKVKRLRPAINDYVASVEALAISELRDPMIQKQDDFALAAQKRLEQKRQNWHWASILAFVRHDGCYGTASQPQQSWNEQFSEAPTAVLLGNNNNGRWRFFERKEAILFQKLQDRLAEECRSIAIDLKKKAGPSASQIPKELDNFIDGQARNIILICNEFRAGFLQSFHTVKYDSTQADGKRPDSYFDAIMKTTWQKCKEVKGKNITAQMMTVLEDDLTEKGARSPFAKLANGTTVVIARKTAQDVEQLLNRVNKCFQDTVRWIDSTSRKNWSDLFWTSRAHQRAQKDADTIEKVKKYGVKAKSEVISINALIAEIENRCRVKAVLGKSQGELVLADTSHAESSG